MTSQAPARSRSWMWVAALALAIVPGVLSWLYLRSAPRKPIDSVAVLPLSFSAADPPAAALAEQIRSGLAQRLSETLRLKVVWPESSALRANDVGDARGIGHELGVRAILRGRLERQQEYFLLTIELAESGDGAMRWSRQYRFRPEQIEALQEELARHLVNQIRWHG